MRYPYSVYDMHGELRNKLRWISCSVYFYPNIFLMALVLLVQIDEFLLILHRGIARKKLLGDFGGLGPFCIEFDTVFCSLA